ncbi:MAG TPA: cytochrome c [Gaiellaceae bacterium]|jgi:mono/diheme cytochrome c family protein
MTRNDVILGIVAAVLIAFSLFVALVVPRRDPGFPGRNLRLFVVVAVLLIVGMLTAVEVFGESHHFAAAGESAPAETGAGTTPTTTGGGGGPSGNPAAGKQIFTTTAQPACETCHTLAEAGATGTVGPNLDDVLKGKDAAFIHESIVDPNAQIASGYQAGIMPQTFGQQLNDQQLADLVAFLVQATKG